MYLIKSGNKIIYDSTDKDTYPVLSPQFEDELNGAGTLSFTVVPGHPYYDDLKQMQTFITAYRDNEELFYGRILSIDRKIDGQMDVQCEGGLTFFLDTEMTKQKVSKTCEQFLTMILENHNSMVETEKQFSLGTINVAKAIEIDDETHQVKKYDFEISGYASTKSVLESLVLGQFGGYFRIRSDGNGGHALDYLEDYGRVNNQPVRIGHNIVDKNDRVSGEEMFTYLRPIYGKDKTIENSITQADITLPNVTKDGEWLILDDMVEQYGHIYHTEAFDKTTKAKECLKQAEDLIRKQGSQLPSSSEIGFVDFYHLNRANFEAAKEEAEEIDYAHLVPGITFTMGNVDLFDRPVISLQKVIDAGWDDQADPDSWATLYSVTYAGGLMKNLNPGAKYNRTHITKQDDGTVIITGNVNERIDYYFISNELAKANALHLTPGTYTAHIEVLSGSLNATGNFGFYYWDGDGARTLLQDSLSGTSVTHTFTNDAYIFPYLRIDADSRPNNANVGFKLERGSSPTPLSNEVDYGLTENLVFLVTPILSYGEVLSPSKLDEYFQCLVDGGALTKTALINADKISNGGKGLLIGIANMPGTVSQSITLADEWAVAVHDTQEDLYSEYVPDIRLGDVFTNIEEFEGVSMTVGSISLNFEDPGADTMTLKNSEELLHEGVTSNSLTVIESKLQIKDAFRYKSINEELTDHGTELSITARKLEISAHNMSVWANESYMTIFDDPDNPGTFKLVALKHGETAAGEYTPTVEFNVNGLSIGNGYTVVNEDGESLAGKTSLNVQKDRITAEISRATGAETSLGTRITATENGITSLTGDFQTMSQTVDGLEDDVEAVETTTETITGSALWQNRDDIAALNGKFTIDQEGKVHVVEGSGLMADRNGASFGIFDSNNLTAGIIVDKVNGGSVSINAAKINLNGQTIADVVTANSASITDITSNGLTNVNHIIATAGVFTGLTIAGETAEWHTLNWNMGMDSTSIIAYKNVRLGHYHTFRVSEENGVVTLDLGEPTTTDPGHQTFNIAGTAFYQQAVSAATATGEATGAASLAGNWSSNLFFAETSTSTQSPASQIIAEFDLPTTISSSALHSGSQTAIDITVTATTSSAPGGSGSPVNFPITVDATPAYNAGVNSVNLSESWNGATYTVSTTGQTTAHSASITLSATSAIVYNSSTHTYLAGATAEAGGATRAYDATPAESGTEAYQAGVTDGEGNVTITAVTPGSQSGPDASNIYTVPISVTASNGATGSGTATVNASDSYTAGETAGAASVTITAVTPGSQSGPDASNVYTVPISVTASNGATGSGTATVDASDSYTAGETAGAAAVTISSIVKDSQSWDSSNTSYNVTVTASASNQEEDTDVLTVSATEAYNAGVTQGEANKAPSSWWAGNYSFSLRNQATRTFSTNIICQRADGSQVKWNYQFTVTAGD